MRGNFPAGKREKRNKRKKPLIFNIRKYSGGRIKISRKPVGTPKYPFVIKNRNYY